MTHPAFRHRSLRRRHGKRLALESLEERRVLTTIVEGVVVHDVNENGQIDETDTGQAAVQVYDDANANGLLDIVGTVVEPDDFSDGQVLNGQVPGVTFSVVDSTGNTLDLDVVAGLDLDPDTQSSLAPTGSLTFGYDDVRFFNFNFKLRVDFDTPASSAQMMFAGVRPFATDFGLFEAYDASDTLVDSYRTDGLIQNDSELMTVTGNENISYVVAYTERLGLTGRFDSLRVNPGESERWTLTNNSGEFSLDVGGAGSYRIRQVAPEGFEQILPAANAGRTAVVGEDERLSGLQFANVPFSAPTAIDDTAEGTEDNVFVIDVLQNDVGRNIDETSVQIETQAANGTVRVLEDGFLAFEPNADFAGDDSFTYSVARNSGERSNAATVSVVIVPVNDAPVANDDTAEGTGVTTINVLDNDTDVDNALDVTSIQIESDPANGSVESTDNGEVVYTPADDFTGVDQFTYSVSDEDGLSSNTATVTVTINETTLSWQNPINPLDVTGDTNVFANDVLAIINELNNPMWSDPVTGVLQTPPDPVPAFFDVNGDNRVNPSDIILVINFLNGDSVPVGARPASATPIANRVDAAAAIDAASSELTTGTVADQELAAATLGLDDNDRKSNRSKVELVAQTVDAVFEG